MKTVAVIPCHNEATHIAGVVTKAKKHVDHVIVIDDGSVDSTANAARGAGAFVFRRTINHGAGFAVSHGINLANETLSPDIIVILDGDGQHDANEIPRLIHPIIVDLADIVMATRLKGGMPKYRSFGNKVLTWLCNTGNSFKPEEAMTGYWAVSSKSLPEITEKRWGWAVELLVKSRQDYRITTKPVYSIYHARYSDNSAVSPVWLGLVLLWMIIKWRFKIEVLRQ